MISPLSETASVIPPVTQIYTCQRERIRDSRTTSLVVCDRARANRVAPADDSGGAGLRRHKASSVSDDVLPVAALRDLHAAGDDDTRNQIHAEIGVHDEEQVDQFGVAGSVLGRPVSSAAVVSDMVPGYLPPLSGDTHGRKDAASVLALPVTSPDRGLSV